MDGWMEKYAWLVDISIFENQKLDLGQCYRHKPVTRKLQDFFQIPCFWKNSRVNTVFRPLLSLLAMSLCYRVRVLDGATENNTSTHWKMLDYFIYQNTGLSLFSTFFWVIFGEFWFNPGCWFGCWVSCSEDWHITDKIAPPPFSCIYPAGPVSFAVFSLRLPTYPSSAPSCIKESFVCSSVTTLVRYEWKLSLSL